ncbi:MAG: helix-turn-helix domain-containing protein [Prosthecobacter sp.]|nr:helix-turn-helix domain-containing protein [Prosthecobacter sp.]
MDSLTGSQLRLARTLRGLSLQDAAHETRIPVQRLEWLEQDNFAAFGSLTYARAFLKIYSTYLGVDANAVLEILPTSRLRHSRDRRYLMAQKDTWVLAGQRSASSESSRQKTVNLRSPVSTGIAIFVLLLIGTGIWGHHVSTQFSDLPVTSNSLMDVPSDSTPAKSALISLEVTAENSSAPASTKANPVKNSLSTFQTGMPMTMQ